MARPVLLSLEDVSLTFGGNPIFDGISLHINSHDKICLIGRNGAGKTTLIKLITGELEIDSGKRFTLPGITIGYLAQDVGFNDGDTVHQFVMSGLPRDEQSEDKHYLADMVIDPLGLDAAAVMGNLSGGQLRRAALARALVVEPDILLLDEPTNHLDLAAIEWLEGYLSSYRGALICVSHDRTFLSNITSKIFWIDRGTILTCSKGYKFFEEWSEQIMEQEARTLQNMQKKLDAEHSWTQGGVTARRKRNVRRMRELYQLRDKLKASKASYNQATKKIKLDELDAVQASKIIAEFKGVTKSFTNDNGRKVNILDDFSLRMLRGDRIGILGKNGSGKSTFLKLLMHELEPDSGRIKLGKNVEISYFDQTRSLLNPKKTVWKTLCPDGGDYIYLGSGDAAKPRHVCGYLKDFLFDPRIAREYVGTLSGGQQNRLLLASLLANPGSVLILDEPTNDLDMDTLDMLQEILADYKGTLIIVSHDRDFLDRTVTSVLAFEGNAQVEEHVGGYSDYLEAVSPTKTGVKQKALEKGVSLAKTLEVQAASLVSTPQKLSYKFKHELEVLPAKIAKLEGEIDRLKAKLSNPDFYTQDPKAFDAASQKLSESESTLEAFEMRWLELDEMSSNSA